MTEPLTRMVTMPQGEPLLQAALGLAAQIAADPAKRAAAAKIAGRIDKLYRKRRTTSKAGIKAKRRKVGEDPGTSNTKQREVDYDDLVVSTRELYLKKLTQIPLDDKAWESRDQRERNVIYISGFKYCMAVRNNSTNCMYFHYAVIAPKNPQEFNGNPKANFFRSPGGPERAVDFSTMLGAIEFDCNPINPDKHTILLHKKCLIGPFFTIDTPNRYQNGVSPNWVNIEGYVPLNRQIRYESNGEEQDGPVWLVYWFDNHLASKNSIPVTGQVTLQQKFVVYFRETQECCGKTFAKYGRKYVPV